jgi:hypothetical protein
VRDVGIFVWITLLIVGVVGSMISSARKSAERAKGPAPQDSRIAAVQALRARGYTLQQALAYLAANAPPRSPVTPSRPVAPPSVAAKPVTPTPAPVKSPVIVSGTAFGHAVEGAGSKQKRRPLFEGRNALVRAVIAAEVLGKPRGLGDEYFPH